MNLSTRYLFHVVGEDPNQLSRLHTSTIKRIKAFAIAIHIPVALWALTGYIIGAKIFALDEWSAKGVAVVCATLIYLVERLVIATPKVWFVNIGRVLIGVVIAILGASTVDLVIFDREVSQQLMDSERNSVAQRFDKQISEQAAIVAAIKEDWQHAQSAANCEANGSCGSGTRSLGPIYRQLAKQAETLRKDFLSAQLKLEALKASNEQSQVIDIGSVVSKAGLLARVQALHTYTSSNPAALTAWILFFLLVLLFEMMVVLSKLVFGETVDDRINAIREEINRHKAEVFRSQVTSPVAHASQLLDGAYGLRA